MALNLSKQAILSSFSAGFFLSGCSDDKSPMPNPTNGTNPNPEALRAAPFVSGIDKSPQPNNKGKPDNKNNNNNNNHDDEDYHQPVDNSRPQPEENNRPQPDNNNHQPDNNNHQPDNNNHQPDNNNHQSDSVCDVSKHIFTAKQLKMDFAGSETSCSEAVYGRQMMGELADSWNLIPATNSDCQTFKFTDSGNPVFSVDPGLQCTVQTMYQQYSGSNENYLILGVDAKCKGDKQGVMSLWKSLMTKYEKNNSFGIESKCKKLFGIAFKIPLKSTCEFEWNEESTPDSILHEFKKN